MSNNVKKGSFVVVSDFHSNDWPLDKIEDYYLREYDCIYILGDATDRGKLKDGSGGIKLLLKIMELSKKYPDRIKYIPGNHDQFLYGYMSGNQVAENKKLMEKNCGSRTVSDVKFLKLTKPGKFKDLMDWLGSLPIQAKHEYEGKTYVMAHALFNQSLYNYNPNYSLKDYYNELGTKRSEQAFDCLWFRKKRDAYSKDELPNYDCVMVIGHTPQDLDNPDDLDLVTDDRKIKVICVDGGITFKGGNMLKFAGGMEQAVATFKGYHNLPDNNGKSSLISSKNSFDTDEGKYKVLDRYIVALALHYIKNPDISIKDIMKSIIDNILVYGIDGLEKDKLKELMYYKMEALDCDKDFLVKYIDMVLANYIMRMQSSKYGLREASINIDGYVNGGTSVDKIDYMAGSLNSITSYGSAREIAKLVTPNDFKMLFSLFGLECDEASIYSYIEKYVLGGNGNNKLK